MSAGPTLQDDIDRLLRRGIIFSVVWLAGIGSAIAIVSGLRAMRLIDRSAGTATGIGRVWWCLVVGGAGVLIWTPVIVAAIANALR